MPELDAPAPEFTLIGADAERYSLAAQRGKPVVLAFYRGDDQPTCSRQMLQYAGMYDELQAIGVELFGISPDSPKSHYAFGCRLELPFPLLSDDDWYVAKQYNVVSRVLGYGRATFVIDANGILRRALRPKVAGLVHYTSSDEILDAARNV
jgi:peroxiredoxin Q/BCP